MHGACYAFSRVVNIVEMIGYVMKLLATNPRMS